MACTSNTMSDSPLIAPPPQASSPSLSDDDLDRPPSPVLHHAQRLMTPGGLSTAGLGSAPADMARVEPEPSLEVNSRSVKKTSKPRTRPLRLLDLPVDILKEIILQLPHTNDLTSLALCHSALHRLTVPCIYSRFDIVWPDESTHTEPRTGVDALTYGLATLVMGDDAFPHQARQRHGASSSTRVAAPNTPYPVPRRRFGNYYAQFTKKFSLGNGPPAWVQEYMITKEGGKMLGTLVALAVARMINLETFVWDMPTGVLRDVWLALSSLADRTDGEECRLECLWIRWHNNSLDSPAPLPAPPPPMMMPVPPNTTHPSGAGSIQTPVVVPAQFSLGGPSAIDRVEHPTFSVIPALKSLSVLDIDELPYLDEMSILIARSQKKLRELRVGIAPHAQQRDWVTAWEGDGIQQVDYSSTSTATTSISERRLGGVLGILVGRVHNLRQAASSHASLPSTTEINRVLSAGPTVAKASPLEHASSAGQGFQADRDSDIMETADAENAHEQAETVAQAIPANVNAYSMLDDEQPGIDTTTAPTYPGLGVPMRIKPRDSVLGDDATRDNQTAGPAESILNGKLRLEVLELERVPLSVTVLLKAFDWSVLTALTLLNCNNHEQLWKSLRRTYTPRQTYPSGSPSSSRAYKASYTLRSEYSLSLKKIHTNTVSPSLIAFLRETLAPNTLEVLFLQEGRSYSSTVTVDAIYRGPLRRHRASLKKLMIDSSDKGPDGHATRWRRWILNRDIITFITSGRMNSLRELAVSIDYKDWHHFLQRLPLIPHIRSLYIPYIADHAHGNNIDPRELAMQILDIVHLRPEIEICYMGISTKCFEILENRPSNYDIRHDGAQDADGHTGGMGVAYAPHDPLLSDEESETSETEDEEEDEFETSIATGGDETSSELSEEAHDDSDDDSFLQDDRKSPRLRIREILFYEEKIETLRARHGTLKP